MKRVLLVGLLSLLMILPVSIGAGQFIKDLVLNYSNFMYVSAIAVGFRYTYFATTNGIVRYNIADERWDEPLTGIEGLRLPEVTVNRLEVSFDDKVLWISTDQGYYEYNEIYDRWDQIDRWPEIYNRNEHLYPDRQYIPPAGYNYMPDGSLIDIHSRIFQLTDIVADSWSNLWIGTWGLGPGRADRHHSHIELMDYGLLQEDVTALYSDEGRLWISGLAYDALRTGITIFEPEANSFSYFETYGSLIGRAASVFDIVGNGDDVFVATENGILVIDKEKRVIVDEIGGFGDLPETYVNCLAAVGDTLFAGTAQGLAVFYFHPDSVNRRGQILLAERDIVALELSGEYLWIGTDRGAYRLNRSTRVLGRLRAAEITQSRYVYDIEVDGEWVWLATEEEMVAIDMETADIELYPEVNNYGGVHAIAVRDTLIAAAVDRGLLLIYDGKKPRHELYTVNEGLLSNEIRDLLFEGDYLWLGTDKGLSRFWYKNPLIL